MNIRKLKAFTLSELLVVLLLTVVVVGLAFAVLNLIQKQMYLAQGNYRTNTELDLLKQALWTDFRSHSQGFYNTEHQQLFLSNALHTIDYRFVEDYVVRQQDTFHISLERHQLFYLGEEVNSGKIDALELVTTKASGEKLVFVYREQDAANHMNQ